MQTIDFLSRVLPSEGVYYGAKLIRKVNPTTGKFPFPREAQTSIGALAKATEKYSIAQDTYYSTGSFKSNTSSEADNILLKKSFYLDVDFEPNDAMKYADEEEAKRAWNVFKKQSGIISPNYILRTGHGWHMYWVLDKAIPAEQWLKIASLFKRVTKHLNFKVDPTVTADLARVLRVPGSRNFKDPDHVVDCEIIYSDPKDYRAMEFLGSISKWHDKIPKSHLKSVASGGYGLDNLDGEAVPASLAIAVEGIEEIEGAYVDRYFKYVGESCAILKEMLDKHGEGYKEPAWKAALNVMVFCEDGKDFLHPISDGHSHYSERATEHKWIERIAFKNSPQGGAGSCESLQNHCGGTACGTCEAKQKYEKDGRVLTSPISFCTEPKEDMPEGFSQSDGKGVWYRNPSDPDAGAIKICQFNIKKVVRNIDTDATGNSTTQLTFETHLAGTTEITLDVAATADYRRLNKEMSNQHITIDNTPSKIHFGTLMNAWSQQLHASGDSVKTQSRFGWVSHGKKHGFSVGGVTQWDDGTTSNSVTTDKKLAADYSATGELADWQVAVQFAIDQGRHPINAVIASSFGAPLMKFTGEAGMILALVSECSASGKSKALALASSVWGNPRKSINSMDDTHVARQIKMGTLCNLPMYWDEIRGLKDDQEFAKQLFRMCQGSDKNRGQANLTLASVGDWQTLMVATSNENLVAHVDAAMPNQSNAGRVRILEFEIPVVTKQQMVGSEVFHNLNDNYGVAGVIYAKYLAENHNAIRKRVRDFIVKINKSLKCDSEDRFWVAGMACTIIGAQLATELELLNFDVDDLKRFFVKAIQGNKSDITHHVTTGAVTNVSEVGRFISAMEGRGLHYASIDSAGVSTGVYGNTIVEKNEIAYEFCPKNRRLKINKGAFEIWLSRSGKDMNQITSDLRKTEPSYKDMKVNFGEVAGGTYGVGVPAFIMLLP